MPHTKPIMTKFLCETCGNTIPAGGTVYNDNGTAVCEACYNGLIRHKDWQTQVELRWEAEKAHKRAEALRDQAQPLIRWLED